MKIITYAILFIIAVISSELLPTTGEYAAHYTPIHTTAFFALFMITLALFTRRDIMKKEDTTTTSTFSRMLRGHAITVFFISLLISQFLYLSTKINDAMTHREIATIFIENANCKAINCHEKHALIIAQKSVYQDVINDPYYKDKYFNPFISTHTQTAALEKLTALIEHQENDLYSKILVGQLYEKHAAYQEMTTYTASKEFMRKIMETYALSLLAISMIISIFTLICLKTSGKTIKAYDIAIYSLQQCIAPVYTIVTLGLTMEIIYSTFFI
jgi:hypothetical protein